MPCIYIHRHPNTYSDIHVYVYTRACLICLCSCWLYLFVVVVVVVVAEFSCLYDRQEVCIHTLSCQLSPWTSAKSLAPDAWDYAPSLEAEPKSSSFFSCPGSVLELELRQRLRGDRHDVVTRHQASSKGCSRVMRQEWVRPLVKRHAASEKAASQA